MRSSRACRIRGPGSSAGGRAGRQLPAPLALLLTAALAAPAASQVVRIPTLPVSPAHQFDVFPSRTAAMGGASVAVADPLLDPFVNPAKGARLAESVFFGSPGLYGVSAEGPTDLGGGRTLPLGALARAGAWFGGVAIGMQQVDLRDRSGLFPGEPVIRSWCPTCVDAGLDTSPDDRTRGNRDAWALVGRSFEAAGLSIGASARWSGLGAVDGVDLLYPGSAQLEQRGHALDVRVGALKELPEDGSIEVLVVHSRLRTTQEALYLDAFWDPGAQQRSVRPRLERNRDGTSVWGLHVEHERPLPAEGWRIGWLGTVNFQSHPAVPDYEAIRIPSDRGSSTALDVGVGVAKTHGASTVGLDLVYEPIWTRTWTRAESPVETDDVDVIPAGDPTMENRFRFSNVLLRLGAEDEVELGPESAMALQLGLAVRSVGYRLTQEDHVRPRERNRHERWTEWTPTWGLALRLPGFEVRYRGQVTHDIRRPGVDGPSGGRCFDVCALGTVQVDVAPADPALTSPVGWNAGPTGRPLSVAVHQVSFSVPLGTWGAPAPARNDDAQEGSR